jgi:hypothetical protein
LAQSPPIEEVLEDEPKELDERDREFEELLENLRGALAPKGEKGKVWLSAEEDKAFRILLVDKVRRSSPRPELMARLTKRASGYRYGRSHRQQGARIIRLTARSAR